MAVLIDLVHARKARRLFGILLERYGLRYFLEGEKERAFKIDNSKLEEAVRMCADWAAMRTGESANDETLAWIRTDVRRLLIQAVAESMVHAGY
jgi:hypothetical protein